MTKLERGIAIPPATELYHPDFIRAFREKFADRIVRTEYGKPFDNGMPVVLVGQASERIVLLSFFNGDNYRDCLHDIEFMGNAFTADSDPAGPNTRNFGVFFPFADLRAHDKDR